MAEWTIPTEPINPRNINDNKEFENGSGVHADDLNNTVKAALYAQDKAEKASKGKDCQILVPNGVALGENSVAGARGFGISAINNTSHIISLVLTSEDSHLTNSVVGKYFSIITSTHFAFCGTITSVSISGLTASIGYTSTTTSGMTTSSSAPWWNLAGVTPIVSGVYGVFWIPQSPTVGYDLVYSGSSLFSSSMAMGDTCYAAADDCFVNGENNVAGGNHAAIFGKNNKGGFCNIVSGFDNFSCGLHSALFGRSLTNKGDYNILGGQLSQSTGNYGLVTGYQNTVSGTCQAVSGQSNTVAGGNNLVGGKGNSVTDFQNIVGGQNNNTPNGWNLISGYGNTVASAYNVVGGQGHSITGTTSHYNSIFGKGHAISHSGVLAAGNGHTSSSNYQTLLGDRAQSDPSAGVIYANGGVNKFTVGKDGTRSNVSTDAVTVGFLNGVDNGSVVEVDTNGSFNQELAPDKFYLFTGELVTVFISFGSAVSGRENEYKGQFTVGSTTPVISFPNTISWVGGSFPTLETNKTYQFSVLNDIGVIVGV